MTHFTTALRCSAFTSRVVHMLIGMFVLITFSSNKHCMPFDICQRYWRECGNRKEATSSTSNPYHPGDISVP